MNLWLDSKARLILVANFLLVVGSGISFIAVPWLLIHRPGGETLFGETNALLTLLTFVLIPYLGKWIDRSSRKLILLSFFLFGCATNVTIAILIVSGGQIVAWHLLALYCLGSLGASVYYPAQFAFNQEVLAREQYEALSGAIEVQWQAGSMIAGGLAAVLIDRVPLTAILGIEITTYLGGFALISLVPYVKIKRPGPGRSSWQLMLEGVDYLWQRPRLSIILFASLLPFLGIMVTNYLVPIFVRTSLRGGAAIYGCGDIAYSAGAVLAGLTVAAVKTRLGLINTLLLTVGVFTIAVAANPLLPSIPVFFGAFFFQGWGNAGSRVARSILMLETIPNEVVGRVNLFYGATERLLRSAAVALVTLQVAHAGPELGYWTVAFIGVCAWVMIFSSEAYSKRSRSFHETGPT